MYVYFEPQGGLNDILSIIHYVLEYCIKHNRILLVNGEKSEYKVNFSDYFHFPQSTVICDIQQIKQKCIESIENPDFTIYPPVFKNKWMDILENKIHFQYGVHGYLYHDIVLDLPMEDRIEDVIIYCNCGMYMSDGYPLFRTLQIQPHVKKICKERYALLQKPYLCIQIRNTDYKCDYESLYNNYKEKFDSGKDLYLATDDRKCIDYFRSMGLSIHNFTTYPEGEYYNLHNSKMDPHIKFIDLFTDIYIIAMSSEIISCSNGLFIRLVRSCHANQDEFYQQFE
jgi:hypothetical protein